MNIAETAETDILFIFDHLFETYQQFGENQQEAFEHAEQRTTSILSKGYDLSSLPYSGTLMTDIMPGLRYIVFNKAIIQFRADSRQREVPGLAVFFGGQDHIRHMYRRILETEPDRDPTP